MVKVCLVNNSVTFCGQPVGSEEFLSWMIETISIIIDICPKGRPCKRESQTIEKKDMLFHFNLKY